MSQKGSALQGGLSATEDVVDGLCGLVRVLAVAGDGGGAGVLLVVVTFLVVVVGVVEMVGVSGTILSVFLSSCCIWSRD